MCGTDGERKQQSGGVLKAASRLPMPAWRLPQKTASQNTRHGGHSLNGHCW